MTVGRPFAVQRVQECLIDVDDDQVSEGEDLRVVAMELAVDINDWDTVALSAEEAG